MKVTKNTKLEPILKHFKDSWSVKSLYIPNIHTYLDDTEPLAIYIFYHGSIPVNHGHIVNNLTLQHYWVDMITRYNQHIAKQFPKTAKAINNKLDKVKTIIQHSSPKLHFNWCDKATWERWYKITDSIHDLAKGISRKRKPEYARAKQAAQYILGYAHMLGCGPNDNDKVYFTRDNKYYYDLNTFKSYNFIEYGEPY